MTKRRNALGLSVDAAAKIAGVSRNTWADVESAARNAETYTLGKIERALRWEPGSAERVLVGGSPVESQRNTEAAPAEESRRHPANYVDLWERRAIKLTREAGGLTDEQRFERIRRIRTIAAEQRTIDEDLAERTA